MAVAAVRGEITADSLGSALDDITACWKRIRGSIYDSLYDSYCEALDENPKRVARLLRENKVPNNQTAV